MARRLLLLAAAACPSGADPSSLYPVFWSVVGPNISLFDRGQRADVTKFGILDGTHVHVGNAGHYRPCGWDCRLSNNSWGQGAFPSIADDGTTTNGGALPPPPTIPRPPLTPTPSTGARAGWGRRHFPASAYDHIASA